MRELKFLTPDEVAEILRVDADAVRAWLRKGQLRGYRIGTSWRIREEDLEAFIERSANIPEERAGGTGPLNANKGQISNEDV